MAPRRPTTADSNKRLPAIPVDALGLDLHGRGVCADTDSCATGSKDAQRRSVRKQSSSDAESISPTTTSSARSASRYLYSNQSSSTLTGGGIQNYSTATLTVPGSPSMSVTSSQTSVFNSEGPETPASRKRVMFRQQASPSLRLEQSSTSGRCAAPGRSAPTTPSSSSGNSSAPLAKKRSSSQLLMGIGKGIGRVGSVMRRNTAEGTSGHGTFSAPSSAPGGAASTPKKAASTTNTWRKRNKMPLMQEQVVLEGNGWESVDRNQGNSGIGRPFNVEHDLHVSPDLRDLPPAWLSSLKAQGLSESDLALISAARNRQQSTPHHHLSGDDFFRAPHSAPAGHLNVPSDSQSSRASSTGMLRKFSFEVDCHTTLTGRSASEDVFGGYPTGSYPNGGQGRRISRRVPSDSYPVSATESEVSESEHSHYQRHLPTAAPTTSTTGRSRSRSDPKLLLPPTPRQTKRLSDQLRGFKDLPIGDPETSRDGEWTKSILGMDFAWEALGKVEEGVVAGKVTESPDDYGSGKALDTGSKSSFARKPSRPCTPESLPKKIARKPPPKERDTPPSSPSLTARESEPASASTTTSFPCSRPPPPKRPDNGHRRSGFFGSGGAFGSLSGSGSGHGHYTSAFVSSREVHLQGSQPQEVVVIPEEGGERAVAIPRTSSESFGVHYSSLLKSQSSVELGLLTPSTSDEIFGIRARNYSDDVEQVDTGYDVDYSSDDEELDYERELGSVSQPGSAKKGKPKEKRQTFGLAPPPPGRDLPRLSINHSPSLPQIGVSPLDVDASTFGKSPMSPSPEPAAPGLPLSPPPSCSPLPIPTHLSASHRNSTSNEPHGTHNRDSLQSTFSRYTRDSRASMRSDRTSRTSHQSLKSWELGEVAHVRHVACMAPSYNVSSASLGDLIQDRGQRSPEIERLGDARGVERLEEESEYGDSEDGARDALDALGQAAQRMVKC
ncbi:hypothetical protein IAR50_006359 [Cryptococcus sp. DSM 104548]